MLGLNFIKPSVRQQLMIGGVLVIFSLLHISFMLNMLFLF